jgi:CheY-like chemotaxis protein
MVFIGGTGLGLYSLSKRVDALGGCYGVTDREDHREGCAFWFTFPYRPDYAAEDAMTSMLIERMSSWEDRKATKGSRTQHKNGGGSGGAGNGHSSGRRAQAANKSSGLSGPAGAGAAALGLRHVGSGGDLSSLLEEISGMRVLVVDDSLTIMKMVSRTLEQHGFVVDTAKNGKVGLKKMLEANLSISAETPVPQLNHRAVGREAEEQADEKYDIFDSSCYNVILMDLQMPVMGK